MHSQSGIDGAGTCPDTTHAQMSRRKAAAAHHSAEDADREPHDCGDMMQQVGELMLDELTADCIVYEISQTAINTGHVPLTHGGFLASNRVSALVPRRMESDRSTSRRALSSGLA